MDFYIISLGCAKNLVDSERLSNLLTKNNYKMTDDVSEASLIIINTCGFIEEAKRESVETILEVIKGKKKNSKIMVFGCLVQRYKKELEEMMPEVDFFLPVMPVEKLFREIKKEFPVKRGVFKLGEGKRICFTPPSYSYIKISDGCNNECSYCTIPFIRGKLKSLTIDEILLNVKRLLDKGVNEINLIAQDITLYGKDLYGKPSLELLLERILSIKRDFWLRLLYLYPSRITSTLIKLIKNDSRIVKYLDIPIQHVSNRILRLMRRHYTKEILINKIQMLREYIPNISIRTSLITGFPTETEDDFFELVEFVKMIRFNHLGVFEYSDEEGTRAFSLKPKVPRDIRRRRRSIILKVQKEVVKENSRFYIGKTLPCLVEMPVDEYGALWSGRIYCQAPEVDGCVYITGYEESMGNIVPVKIKRFKNYDFLGACCK
jgi:ribosomal protein S12 methylthiotransferase